MKGTNTGNVRMVNLSCRKCGMSLDCDASHMQAFCPNCGGRLFITVSQVMDILNGRKEMKESKVMYSKDLRLRETVNEVEKGERKIGFMSALLIAFAILLISVGVPLLVLRPF